MEGSSKIIIVRIVSHWNWSNFARHTPQQSAAWDGIQFTIEPITECDYVIIINSAPEETVVNCAPEHIWSIVQEPPTEYRKFWHINPSYSWRMFTTDTERTGKEYIQSQPALSWYLKQDYDFLHTFKNPKKTDQLSWVTSNEHSLKGHRNRLHFLKEIQGQLTFDLWGRGFHPIDNKWDGLAPYRYSLAIENYSNEFYWSEKLSDCYLAWCMPIYYGCTRITNYFPAESMIQIDINDPKGAIKTIEDAMADQRREKNLDAIAHARELALNRYQFFPFIANQIRHFEATYGSFSKKQLVTIRPRIEQKSMLRKTYQRAKSILKKLVNT